MREIHFYLILTLVKFEEKVCIKQLKTIITTCNNSNIYSTNIYIQPGKQQFQIIL